MAWRVAEQFAALYIKNALVAWRNRRATILRFTAPFVFLLLALLIDKALQANNSNDTAFKNLQRPESEAINPIPQCNEDVYIGSKPCIELAYSPNNTVATTIIDAVVSRNAKPIKPAVGFATREEVQAFLLANPDYALGAVHFIFDDPLAASPQLQGFVIQTNTTTKTFKDNTQDPNKFMQLPLQSAVHREIARYRLRQSASTASLADTLSWYIGLKPFAHPTISSTSTLGSVLGPLVFAALMFSFVTQISAVVMEKEMGLRQAMVTMGLRDSAYWLSWAAWELTLAFLSGHLITVFGLILQFDMFLHNSYGLLFFLFFLFQAAMSSLALLAASFISKTQTAVYLGFTLFIVGWIMQTVIIFGVPYGPDFWTSSTANTIITAIFSIFPWDLLMKGVQDLANAVESNDAGISWGQRTSYCQNIDTLDDQNKWAAANGYDPLKRYVDFSCVMPLSLIFEVLIILWIGFLVVAIYLDNLMNQKRSVFYFLLPSYWAPSTISPVKALSHVLSEDGKGPPEEGNKDVDVAAEEDRVRALLQHRTGHTTKEGELAAAVDVRNAIEVFGLRKKFGGSRGCCGNTVECCVGCACCSCRAAPAFWPIKGSWLAIEQNQLFCLLGPNGAGKTTTINCLTGVLPPTLGDALVYGQSIRSAGGLDKIRALMGVCPQFDVLWPELSGREHLLLYGRIKGCGWSNVVTEADTLLEKVKLTYAATQRSGAYSGGMKRRLSVAIALLGDPKVVYLDEPTTGMDPISRRYVWDIIQEAKVGRAIVLTTHSMEEADILGDRIAIMALGRLRCIGTSLRLKQRFGSGYQVAVSVQPAAGAAVDPATLDERRAAVAALFKAELGLEPTDVNKAYSMFLVPRDREEDLVPFLASLEKRAASLGLTDIQLSLTSLEEVFLTIAKNAALEAAQAGQRGAGQQPRTIPLFSTCVKGCVLAVTLPVSIFAIKYWKRFLFGKDKDANADYATLPDGTAIPVHPGQEFVQDEAGNTYQVLWGVDDSGNLVVQETRPREAWRAPSAALTGLAPAASGGPVYVPAAGGKARIPLPGNVIMEVAVGDTPVMNPLDGTAYHLTWAKDGRGGDVVTACVPAATNGAAPTVLPPISAAVPPVDSIRGSRNSR